MTLHQITDMKQTLLSFLVSSTVPSVKTKRYYRLAI